MRRPALLTVVIFVVMTLLATTALALCPLNVQCPAHDVSCYFTGRTQLIGGHLFGVYHCPAGNHDLLARCD